MVAAGAIVSDFAVGLLRNRDEVAGTRYQMREKVFAIGGDFWIQTDGGERAFKWTAKRCAEDRVVVSEPVSDLPGAWREAPESTALIIQRGPDEQKPFRPRPPADASAAAPRSGPLATH